MLLACQKKTGNRKLFMCLFGKKIWIDPTIRTKYYSRSGYSRLFIQYFNYGYYKIRGIQKRRQIISIRHLVPSLFVVGLFCTIFYGLYINNPIISVSVFFPYIEHDEEKINFFTPAFLESSASLTVDK